MRAFAERNRLLRDWLLFLEDYPLVVGPVSNELPFAPNDDIASEARAHELYRAQTLMVAVNLLGLPAAAVATGLVDGVPVGVQIIGSRYREDLCLDAAQAIEDEAGQLTPVDPVF
jgi:amidase